MDWPTGFERRGVAFGLLVGLLLAAIPLVSHLPRPVVLVWQWPAASLDAALMQGDEVVASLSMRRRCAPASSAPMAESSTHLDCEPWPQREDGDRVRWPVQLQAGTPYRLHIEGASQQVTYQIGRAHV